MDHIFDAIEQEKNKQFLLRVSYMEIYNDEVSDLLAPKQSRKDSKTDRKSKGLRILDDEDGAVSSQASNHAKRFQSYFFWWILWCLKDDARLIFGTTWIFPRVLVLQFAIMILSIKFGM